ncbi:hypothetical protein M9458_046870, partial [Cirrhinus mrigala]
STPDPEPSPPSPRCAEHKPEPTNDRELEPTATTAIASWSDRADYCGARDGQSWPNGKK